MHCGAALAFDADSSFWKCDYCGSKFTLAELQQGDEFTTKTLDEAQPGYYSSEAVIFTCPSCGGRIITDHNTTATFCAYCHNPTVIASRITDEFRPTRIVPFKIGKEEAMARIKEFCQGKPFLPQDFRTYAERGEITGLYVPYWLYSCGVEADLKGEGAHITRWSDSNYNYTKTDRYQVERQGTMQFENVPGDGSARLDDRLMQGLEPFAYHDLKEFTMEYLAGFFAESYDKDATQIAQVVLPRIDSAAHAA
ncbi:MAG: hypothetical protein FWF06_04950, partial [Symbiobacteriaceae bacterium]|nr:hypothetical protein [Symbiobacteriaceae bacterium]